ncbi:MAG: uroporphyrinogen-III synthase [Janthinobacterium lividum]
MAPESDSLILITRPLSEAQVLARSLIQEGCKVLIDPLLQIRALECSFIDTRHVQAFATTSMNGIRRLAELSPNRDIPLYTVGEVSAHEAEKMGFTQVYGAEGSIESLTQVMQNNIDPKAGKILYFSGQEIKGNLVNILTQKDYDIERLVVYEALAAQSLQPDTKEALITGRLKAILFFSPRTSEIFVNLSTMYAQAFKNIAALCLSPDVALPLRKLQWQQILIAPEKTGRSMVSLLTETCREQKEMF